MSSSPFKLNMPILKSLSEIDDTGETHYFIYGLASGVNVDLENDRMADSAIHAFKDAIDRGKLVEVGPNQFVKSELPLRSEHQSYWDSDLGWLVEAEVDLEKNLWIKAELDQDNSRSMSLYKKLTKGNRPGRPMQLGLSVGGYINKVRHEFDTKLSKDVRIIEDVSLEEISVTSQPANPLTYVMAFRKSLDAFTGEIGESTMPDIETKLREQAEREGLLNKSEEVSDQGDATEVENTTTEDTSTQSESAEEVSEEEATPSEESGDGVVEKSVEEQPDLHKMVESLQSSVTELAERVNSLAPVQKSEAAEEEATQTENDLTKSDATEEEATPTADELTKSIESTIESRLVTALTAAFETFKKDCVDPLAEKMDFVKSEVERISAEPLDKSAAVAQQKSGELTAFDRFEKNLESSTSRPIFAALKALEDQYRNGSES